MLVVAVASVAVLAGAGCGDDEVDTGGATTGVPSASTETIPARTPDVTGVVARPEPASGPAIIDASDDYFEGMGLLLGDPVIVDEATGEALSPTELEDGAVVAVWIEGPCAESYPVQCTVIAIQVRR